MATLPPDAEPTHLETPIRFGVISDTHGRLPAGALRAFDGVDRIVHCGDVGDPDVLIELEALAPVEAVRGNTDPIGTDMPLPETRHFLIGRKTIAVAHGHQAGYPDRILNRLTLLFTPFRPAMICYGHTHRYAEDSYGGILFLNPGSAGSPRGGGGPSVAVVEITAEGAFQVRRVRL